jgi:hypothetical protein
MPRIAEINAAPDGIDVAGEPDREQHDEDRGRQERPGAREIQGAGERHCVEAEQRAQEQRHPAGNACEVESVGQQRDQHRRGQDRVGRGRLNEHNPEKRNAEDDRRVVARDCQGQQPQHPEPAHRDERHRRRRDVRQGDPEQEPERQHRHRHGDEPPGWPRGGQLTTERASGSGHRWDKG